MLQVYKMSFANISALKLYHPPPINRTKVQEQRDVNKMLFDISVLDISDFSELCYSLSYISPSMIFIVLFGDISY